MIRFNSRLGGCLIAVLAAAPALAETAPTLSEVQRLAVEHQPLLDSQSAQIAAARARAVSARQLPDPQLKLGVQNLPVDTADAWRFNRDSMTQSMIGLMQEFPLEGKRALKGESESLKAAAGEADLSAIRRGVERDAGLAFVDLLQQQRAAQLVRAQIIEARRAQAAAEIAYRSGQRGQADVLTAQAAVAMLEDKAAAYDQNAASAGEGLERWTGAVPGAALEEPDQPSLPPLATLLDHLPRHPELVASDRGVDRAEVDLSLARKSRQPDLNVELDYGYRTDYSDMVSLQVGIPLPIFTRNRQDRDIAAARSDLDAQAAMREDLGRRLQAEVSGIYREWEGLGIRIRRYQAEVLPPLSSRVEAALAEYRSGSATFGAVLEARQALLDAQLFFLDLRLQRLRSALKLRYYVME